MARARRQVGEESSETREGIEVPADGSMHELKNEDKVTVVWRPTRGLEEYHQGSSSSAIDLYPNEPKEVTLEQAEYLLETFPDNVKVKR